MVIKKVIRIRTLVVFAFNIGAYNFFVNFIKRQKIIMIHVVL